MFIPTIKVVSSNCNLRCIYCYYNGIRKHKKTVLDSNTLTQILIKFLAEDTEKPRVNFYWHGGEPLLAGISFYEKVLYLEDKYNILNKKIRNSVQTNLTLLDEKWADFLLKNNFNIGVSIDGPAHIHNKNRPTANGSGSFDKVLRGLTILQNNGFYPNAIAVITKHSLKYTKEIFDFFISNQIYTFHPKECYEVDSQGKMLSYSITPDEYTDFLIELFDIWMNTNNPKIRIRNLYHIMKGLLEGEPSLCEYSGHCHLFLTIEFDGSVSSCDSFPIKQYYMGNINNESLDEIVSSVGYKSFSSDIAKTKNSCPECQWWKVCHGGCMRYSYSFEKEIWHKNIFCDSKKKLFSYMAKRIKEIELKTIQKDFNKIQ